MAWKKQDITSLSDEELIEGCLKANSKYQEAFYKRYFSFAMSIAIRYFPNQSEAMAIVNDSYVKVFENLSSYNLAKPFKPWFATILVNTAIDSLRRNQKHSFNLSIDDNELSSDIEPEVEQSLSADDIIKLFAKLPEVYRITFNLYEIEGYTHEEIGVMLGVATSTSRSNLTRAKRMIQKLYKLHINSEKRCHEAV
jgi:RNA polymerase sigma-70 factor (ECF subfamily)